MKSLTVAKILKPQGIRGEIKVMTFTDSPADLQAFDRVYVGGNAFKLLKVRPQSGDCAFITLSGIADRNAAETLRNLDVEVDREDIPKLPEGTYYIADVIGCTVVTQGGEELGVVKGITPARTDVYEYAKPDGKSVSFAAVEGVILSTDVEAKVLTVDKGRLSEVAIED